MEYIEHKRLHSVDSEYKNTIRTHRKTCELRGYGPMIQFAIFKYDSNAFTHFDVNLSLTYLCQQRCLLISITHFRNNLKLIKK